MQRHFAESEARDVFVGPCCIRYPRTLSSVTSPLTQTHSDSDNYLEPISSIPRRSERPSFASHMSQSPPYRPSSIASGTDSLSHARGTSLNVPKDHFIRSGSGGSSPISSKRSISPSISPSDITPQAVADTPQQRTSNSAQTSSALGIWVSNAADEQESLSMTQAEIATFKCLCAPRSGERLMFHSSITLWNSHDGREHFEENTSCETKSQSMYLFETTPSEIWKTTRRLVFSTPMGNAHHCRSFWLPLADIHLQKDAQDVRMAWSDCNHIKAKSTGNFGDIYNWSYDPEITNHNISIQFSNISDAISLSEHVRHPSLDPNVRLNYQMVISSQVQAHIYNIVRTSPRTQRPELHYRMIVLSEHYGPGTMTYKLYCVFPDMDLRMRFVDTSDPHDPNPAYYFTVAVGNLSALTYHSDIRGEPAPDPQRKAKCKEVFRIDSTALIRFPVGTRHNLPEPPEGMPTGSLPA
jgi:hypothetical protein